MSDLQRAKLERIYRMKDFDGDGRVSVNDFILWGKKVSEFSGLDYTPEIQKGWEECYSIYFPGDTGEDIEKFVKKSIEFSQTENAIEFSAKLNLKLFACVDSNNDGLISWEEFKAFVMPFGVSEDDARFAFTATDENGDGVLSKEELCEACTRYYLDAVDSKYKHFYGRFDSY